MSKTTYTAIDPDGGKHTRKTDRTYSHAVVVHTVVAENDPVYLQRELDRVSAYPEGQNKDRIVARLTALLAAATGEAEWLVAGFCGRYDLAVKTADKQRKFARNLRVEIVEAVA